VVLYSWQMCTNIWGILNDGHCIFHWNTGTHLSEYSHIPEEGDLEIKTCFMSTWSACYQDAIVSSLNFKNCQLAHKIVNVTAYYADISISRPIHIIHTLTPLCNEDEACCLVMWHCYLLLRNVLPPQATCQQTVISVHQTSTLIHHFLRWGTTGLWLRGTQY